MEAIKELRKMGFVFTYTDTKIKTSCPNPLSAYNADRAKFLMNVISKYDLDAILFLKYGDDAYNNYKRRKRSAIETLQHINGERRYS